MRLYTYAALAAVSALVFSAPDPGGAGGLDLSGGGDSTDPGAATDPGTAGAASLQGGDGNDAIKAAAAPAPAKPRRGAAAAAEAVVDDGLVEAIVRRGHVDVGTFAEPDLRGPGETVRLDAKTVARLRADGVLVDPDAAELPEWKGPTVGAA